MTTSSDLSINTPVPEILRSNELKPRMRVIVSKSLSIGRTALSILLRSANRMAPERMWIVARPPAVPPATITPRCSSVNTVPPSATNNAAVDTTSDRYTTARDATGTAALYGVTRPLPPFPAFSPSIGVLKRRMPGARLAATPATRETTIYTAIATPNTTHPVRVSPLIGPFL